MASMFLAKRGTANIYRASFLHRDYNNSIRSVADGVSIISSSRHISSHGNNGREKSKQEGMGTTTDGKAANVTMSHAADTAKEGLERATNAAIEKSGDASKPKRAENNQGGEEKVAAGEDGSAEGQSQSSG